MSAMRFLNLIDGNARPTARLRVLPSASGEHRAALLRQVAEEAYAFVFKGTLDTQNATYAELEDVFQNTYNMKSVVCRKCIKFFTEISKDAGISLSPQITKKRKVPRTNSGTKNTNKKVGTRTNENFVVPIKESKIPELFHGTKCWLINSLILTLPGMMKLKRSGSKPILNSLKLIRMANNDR